MTKRKPDVRHIGFILAVLFAGIMLVGWDDAARGFELYLKRSLVTDAASVSVRELSHSFSGKPYALDLESIRLPLASGRLQILMPRAIREAVSERYSGQLILVGRGTVVIPGGAAGTKGAEFFEKAGAFLLSEVTYPLSKIEMEYSIPPDMEQWAGRDISFSLTHAKVMGGVPLGAALLKFRDADGAVFGDMSVVLHMYAHVAFPRRTIGAGQRFDERDVEDREVDLAAFPDELLSGERMTGAYTASQALYPDRPIPLKRVAHALFVRAGDKVNLTLVRKNITIGLRGRALGSGGLDDRVAVSAEGSRRRFQGLVTGDKEVLIELQ
jgi:flagella basal body P-ring formation protein FlgA